MDLISISHFIAADVLLVIFFFALGLELIEEFRNGDLSNPKRAAIPAIAAVGGVLIPIVIFLAGLKLFNITDYYNGWAIPTATDVAFSLAILGIFGKKVSSSVKLFVLVLAVVDDIIGIFIIAFMYSNNIGGLEILGVICCLIIWRLTLSAKKITIHPALKMFILTVSAIGTWYFTLISGIHPTIAGVFLGVLVPTNAADLEQRHKWHSKKKNWLDIKKSAVNKTNSQALRWFRSLTPICNYVVVPIFAIVSISVSIYHLHNAMQTDSATDLSELTYLGICVAIALIFGKPFGILLFTWISHHLTPLELFHGLRVRDLFGASFFCGIGFTVSILISTISYEDDIISAFAQIGVVVGSLVAVLFGVIFQMVSINIIKKKSKK